MVLCTSYFYLNMQAKENSASKFHSDPFHISTLINKNGYLIFQSTSRQHTTSTVSNKSTKLHADFHELKIVHLHISKYNLKIRR